MDVQRTRSLQGYQVIDGPILEDRRMGQAAPFVLKLVLKRALTADMQPDLIPMEATFDGGTVNNLAQIPAGDRQPSA